MFQSRKKKSIPSLLHDRELNLKGAPYFTSLNVISQIIRSRPKDSLYDNHYKLGSPRPINYDSGYLYYSDYSEFSSIYSRKSEPSPILKMEKSQARMKVSDVISYSVPIYKNVDEICRCKLSSCTCLSQYLLSVSEDNWLCQHMMKNGKLMKQIYVNRIGHNFRFKYCDWDVYGDRFVLTSTLNPDVPKDSKKKLDVVVNLAIFNVFPIEFFALLEIKRSVFGESCTAANISDQHIILGKSNYEVNIYSFEDFLKEGDLTVFKLGDDFGREGKVGSYPMGLPLNFQYSKTPPLLFNVHCYGQIIRFGGYPYHYITASTKENHIFTVSRIETKRGNKGISLASDTVNDEAIDSLLFHPDHSNRLIFRTNQTIDCYKLYSENNVSKISKLFSMGFLQDRPEVPTVSSFGRKIIRKHDYSNYPSSIYSTDYANDLNLFAILGVCGYDSNEGFVKLYDNVTGEEVRTLELKEKIYDYYFYQLFVDMGSIIIIERRTATAFIVHVYHL